MPWGQGIHRSRSGSVRKNSWLDTPGGDRSWPKGKMPCSACVRQRVTEAETSDHVHLRKQETVSQWGPGGSVCQEGCPSLSKLSLAVRRPWRNEAVTERTWLSAEGRIPGRALGILASACPVKGTLDRVGCFMRRTHHRLFFLACPSRLQQQHQQQQQRSNSAQWAAAAAILSD